MQMHKLVHGYEMPEHYQDAPKHTIHLALQWKDELKSDSSMTMARIAERNGFSRARVTQIMGFLKLDREIQRRLLDLSEPSAIRYFSERKLRQVTSCRNRKEQVLAFKRIAGVHSWH